MGNWWRVRSLKKGTYSIKASGRSMLCPRSKECTHKWLPCPSHSNHFTLGAFSKTKPQRRRHSHLPRRCLGSSTPSSKRSSLLAPGRQGNAATSYMMLDARFASHTRKLSISLARFTSRVFQVWVPRWRFSGRRLSSFSTNPIGLWAPASQWPGLMIHNPTVKPHT